VRSTAPQPGASAPGRRRPPSPPLARCPSAGRSAAGPRGRSADRPADGTAPPGRGRLREAVCAHAGLAHRHRQL